MNSNISYNSFKKTFEMDGRKLPSVSRVLSFGEPEPGAWIIPYAERGTRIHELCDEYDSGTMWLPPDQEHEFEFESYLKALKELGLENDKPIIEHACYHKIYLYQGRIDRIYAEKKIIVDIKSGKENPKNEIQLNAYSQMYDIHHPELWRLINIHLRKDEWFIKEFKYDEEIFAGFLEKLGKMNRSKK